MKKLLLGIFLMGFVFVFVQGAAQATLYSFGDSNNYWGDNQRWANGESWTDTYNTAHNDTDVIGTPELTGGTIETDSSGALEKIKIAYDSVSSSSSYAAGDLFLDTDGDFFWDYFVDVTATSGATLYKVNNGVSVSAKKGQNDNYYDLSTGVFKSDPETWYRNYHPVHASDALITASTEIGSLQNFTDFVPNSAPPTNYVVFDFDLANTINNVDWSNAIIGFAPTCANDVIYQHVPEPATVLLIGFGLVGLGLCSSSKMRKG